MTALERSAVVTLHSVFKRYGRGRTVLTDVDLEVWPADILTVTGGNGSGKSTLLRIIAGLSSPSSGRLTRTAGVVGYVPERFPAHERMSALAYLRHVGRIRGLRTPAATRRAADLLDRLALAGGADTPIRRLSKGNAQKVAVAQALLVRPDLLILDEPWSGLDASVHPTLGALMAETARDGGAVIFTDHREAVTGAQATRMCRIDQGRLTGIAEPPPRMPSVPSPAVIRVVLVPAPGRPRPSSEPDWPALPGVVGADRRDGAVHLLVASGAHDRLVVDAVALGWSIAEVGAADVPTVHGRGEPR
ncbi:ATP-binding cassette domain-containing protein [Actinoallomurus sp. CA-150999]|uniref:ATP-binding cassette domain-containing protein n=1 Tax=Actinoallomurus sp. CA-150999 TaxID=3239887 RepID=UPI003D8F1355